MEFNCVRFSSMASQTNQSWWLGVAGGVAVGVGAGFVWSRASVISPSTDEKTPNDGPALYKKAKTLIPGGKKRDLPAPLTPPSLSLSSEVAARLCRRRAPSPTLEHADEVAIIPI